MGEVELPPWLKALPQAPEFYPTEAEFADPIAYILKVEEEAKQYGICKIIPPFTKASKKVVVNNLNRSLSMSFSNAVQGSCAPLSRSMGGAMGGPQLAKPKGLFLDASCTDLGNKGKFATRRQQLGWNPKRARGVAHSQNHKLVWQSGESYTLEQFETKAKIFSRSRLGTCKDVSPLSVESLFWRAAADKPISVEYANDIPGSAFAESADSFSLTPLRLKKRKRALEDADQRTLDSIFVGCRSEDKFQEEEVQATSEEFDPSDAAKAKNGSLENGGDNAGGAGSKLANSAWNMRNVARSQGSLLRFMPEEVPGVTSPMVYIGMLFSWFAWHVEDHELHSLNYLHMGASKTWYAVPGDAAPALEEAIRVHGYGGYLNPRAAFSLLGEKTTVMSPEVLVAAGVPCCRLVQNAGEYVVTFPRAYHLGFSHGFNCGEAANFATPGWLAVAKEAAARRAAMNYLPMLSHQQLLYLLTMSLPLRMPASSPSEPRSSRLKVRKKSAGEEMVKSMFLHDVVHNNRLLRILLENGVSRCLLAKDAVHQIPAMSVLEDSKHQGFVPSLGTMENLHSVPEFSSEGGDGSHLPSQQVSVGEETENPIQNQLPSCAPVSSELHGAIFEDLVKVPSVSTGPSSFMPPAKEHAPHYVETHPIHLKNQELTTSLAVDWGTLPCAACGILCYATMAVVEPTATAAMTFKPIFAAAGLGHCAFEAEDSGTMTACLPAFSHPRSIQVEASRDNSLVGSFQPAYIDGSIKQDEQGSSLPGVPDFSSKSPVVIEFGGQIRPTEYGHFSSQATPKPSEEVQGSVETSATTTHFDSKEEAGCLGHHTVQMSDTGLAMDMKSGMFTGLVNTEQKSSMGNCDIHCLLKDPGKVTEEELGVCIVIGTDCTTDLGTTSDAKALESGDLNRRVACGESCSTMPSGRPLFITPMPVSICQKTESQIIPCIDEQPKMCPLQSLQNNDPNYVKIEGSPKAAKVCCEQEKQPCAFSVEEHGNSNGSGVSSLQLLASNYDDSSDLEDENMFQAAEGCTGLLEDETSVDDADGSEVLARPHSGVGDLLTDEIGLSADVPWLSLVPVTENTDIPAPIVISPSFTFSSLVEGPKSLENVFISAGFSFLEEDETADPANLGSSLTGEQLGKQSGEAASVDGDVNNPTSHVHGGDGVIDMQELYHRINSQALTVESDGDEQFLIHFGLRPPRCGVPQESFDLEEPKSISTVASICQVEPKKLSVTTSAPSKVSLIVENTSTSSIPSTMGLGLKNPSPSSAPGYMDLAMKNPLKGSGAFDATAEIIQTGSVRRLNNEMSVGGTSSITSTQGEAAYPQMKVYTKKSGSLVQPESKHAPPRACNSVARPRVLCLEHAVEAQQQLRSVGGSHVLIVCHSDFENYELRAKHLTEEFGIEHAWRHVPFSEAADDEISMVNTAADVDDDDGGRGVNDWVMQMGLFFHHRFQERESESSDDALNVTEDFRAGPFSGVKPRKPAGRRLMAGRLGLSRNSEGHPISCSGRSSQITVRDSRRLSKTSKKKKCMVAGKWCGRVWRVNQVHPFLGGCRKMDPSLQLGMSSTSLYALSVMSECDGGKYRKGISSSRIEASPSGFLIPVKSTEDQQSIAVRNRGRKRKVLDQGMPVQPDNGSEGERRMVAFSTDCTQSTLAVCMVGLESGDCSSSPKEHGALTESVNGSGCLDITINVAEESFTVDDCQRQLTTQMFPHCAHQPDADPAVQAANTDFSCPCVHHQMLSPIPLASRDPSETGHKNNGLNIESAQCGALDKYIPTAVLAGGKECCGPNDNMRKVTSPPLPVPSEAQQVADVKVLELPLVPSAVCLGSTPRPTAEEDSGWHKTASLTNVYSTLPHIGRVVKMVKSNNGSNSSLVSSSTPFEGNKISGTGNAASCVWRDVPVACAPSFHALTTPTGQFTNQSAHPFPSRNHNHVYIPYVSCAVREPTLESQTSPNELYSVASKSFASFEQGGIKLQDVHLLQGKDARHIPETGTSEGNLDQGSPNVSSKSSTGKPILYIEHGTSVQHLETSKLLGVKRKRDRQIEPGYLGGHSMEAGVPSLLDIGTGSQLVANAENCCERRCDCRDLCGSVSEQVVCKTGTLQQSQQDIKNVVRLCDVGVPFTSELAEEQTSASHLNVCRTQDGRSTSNDSDPAHLQDGHHQNCRLYDKKQSVELTPVLSLDASLIRSPHQGIHGGSGVLGFGSDTGQGVALEDPVGSLLPQRASSRGRSAVKARGKRPKHVGWTHHKPAHPDIPGEISVNSWALKPHSSAQVPTIFTLQPEECVEARFEAEDCDRVLESLDQSKGPTSLIPSLGLQPLAADDNESEEENDKPKKIVAKPKKKSKPKKKRVPTRKTVHEDGEFQCDLDGCRMSFASDAELQIHKRNRCTFKGCGKRFFMHKYLLQHRRVHLDERPLKCPWKGCKQAFKWAWARTEHIRVHTGERPYACPDCDQTFRFVSDFSRHKRNTGHTKS